MDVSMAVYCCPAQQVIIKQVSWHVESTLDNLKDTIIDKFQLDNISRDSFQLWIFRYERKEGPLASGQEPLSSQEEFKSFSWALLSNGCDQFLKMGGFQPEHALVVELKERHCTRPTINSRGCYAAIVASIHRQQIAQVERLIGKGRNHEAFAVTLADGTCLILRVSITIPSRHLPHFKTASEVATMNYVRQHTSIPVPRVLAWYSHLENPVGNEYILMTAIEGSSLLETLSSMSLADKTAVLDQIIDYQHQLDDLNFDMYGSLYQNADLTYYIGRTTSVEICYVCYPDLAILQFRKGPWTDPKDIFIDTANGILKWFEVYGAAGRDQAPQQQEACKILKDYTTVIPSVIKRLQRFWLPVLHHKELYEGNIMVSGTTVTGLIDWECVKITPLLDVAEPPKFLRGLRSDSEETTTHKVALREHYRAEMKKTCPELAAAMSDELNTFFGELNLMALKIIDGRQSEVKDKLLKLKRDWKSRWHFEAECLIDLED